MTTSPTRAERTGSGLRGLVNTRKVSKPRMSRLILVATGLVIAVVLLVWLTLWINPKRRGIGGRWIAQRGLARPWIPHQAVDVEQITGAATGSVPESEYESFRDVLREHLARAGERPVVLYLSAAGVLDDQGAVLLRDEGRSIGSPSEGDDARQGSISLEELLAVFKEAGERYPAQSQFLIWDVGQVGSDRNLGVYGNGFLPKLRARLAENPIRRLAILCSCAPGQTSWSSELDGRSVFGYFVEQGLHAGGSRRAGLTVRSFSQRVRSQVALWVRNHRLAEQTPELLGDESVDFALPRLGEPRRTARTEAEESEEVKRLLKRLEKAWTDRDAWQARKPYREIPRPWLRYLETLLRAERHFRAAEYGDAELTLNALPNLANEARRVPPLQGSLAILERGLARSDDKLGRSELAAARENLQGALDQILGGEDAAKPPKPGDEEPAKSAPPDPAPPEKSRAKAAPDPAGAGESARSKTRPAPPPPPAAPPVENEAGAMRKPNSSLSTRSLTSRRRVDSPLNRLVAADDDQRPLYPEAQLLVWASTFLSRGPDHHAFRGRRGETLEEAVKTRLLAEEVAASDERISRWIRPWVDAGDRARRKAQDLLFDSDPTLAPCLDSLEKANEAYLDAKKNAEVCEQAIDLVEQLSAELPYYGEWKARRTGRPELGLDPPFVDLLDATAELARLIHDAPPAAQGGDDGLASLGEKIQRIKAQTTQVATAYHNLADDFRNHWEGGRWRDLDAALCVPLIPADVRMRMLERVRSRPIASALAGAPSTESPAPASDATSRPEAGSSLGGVSVPRVGSRLNPTSSGYESTATDATLTDPGFWRLASGLARLEVGLLEIGGIKKDEAASLRDAVDRACRRLGTAPFADFADISERIRNLRDVRLTVHGEKTGADRAYDDLAAADRAARVMPLADSSGRIDNATETLIRSRRRDLMTWNGRRLAEDFAPRHALVLYERAKDDFGDSADLEHEAERAKAMSRARLLVETNAPEQFTIDEQPSRTLAVKVKPEGPVPPGVAVAFVAYDAQAPLAVRGKSNRADPSVVSPVVIDPLNPPQQADFEVERADSTPESVSIRLEPGAFYRGHIFPKDLSASSLTVRLNPSKEGIDVLLRQSDRKLVKIYGDQFDRHPGQGFLHPHTPLAYRFLINHSFTKPTKVWVRYGLEGKDETFVTKPDLKLEAGRPNDEIRDRVDTDLHEIPVTQPRYLVLEIRKDNESGRVLFRRRYPFRQVTPAEYMRVQQGFDEVMNMAYVNVWHLQSDPVSGPSELTVMLGGQSLSSTLDRGKAEQWWRVYPQPPPPVGYRIQVEKVPDAFRGMIDTGVAPPQPPKAPAL